MLSGQLSALFVSYEHVVGQHREFLASLRGRLDPTEMFGLARGPAPAQPLEALTERELIVLKYLPTMLKAGEIGADLFVSVNTVKAHLRSIYRKFDVSNRREAVDRARALGLL
jgi:LuxR family transcriptional regulator, maltose regulon positive regulatory protein